MTTGFDQAARSWVIHLRHGGSTPWLEWVPDDAGRPDDAGPQQWPDDAGAQQWTKDVPGAAQAELVRRLAARRAAHPDLLTPPEFAALADLALQRSGPGRGLGHLPLLWPTGSTGPTGPLSGSSTGPSTRPLSGPSSGSSGLPLRTPTSGPPGVDPALVPKHELARVGVGVLVDLLLLRSIARINPARRHFRAAAPRYHLAGAPVTAAVVGAGLPRSGRPGQRRPPQTVVFAAPLDQMLSQVWSARVQRGSQTRWSGFVTRSAARDRLPSSVDLAVVARQMAGLVGREQVHVVVAHNVRVARRTACDILDLRAVAAPSQLQPLPPAAVELLRRVNEVLAVRVAPDGRPAVVRELTSVLYDDEEARLTLPPRHRIWAATRSTQMVDQLRADGYPVHGDLDQIVLRHDDTLPDRVRPREVLEHLLEACLRLAATARPHGEAPSR